MELEDDLTRLVREGMEHWVDNRDKPAAIAHAVDRLQDIGFSDWLREKLSASIDLLKLEAGGDSYPAYDSILRRTLMDRIGYEATEVDFSPSKGGLEDLEAPEPAR